MAASANTANIQNLSYTFDAIGNLLTRNDTIDSLNETFTYDPVNRLTQATGAVTKSYQYNAIGNITTKSDVGSYTYNASGPNSTRPHAVTATSGTLNSSYTYDANGNMLTGAGRTMTYTSFNKPKSIKKGSLTVNLTYDPNYNRIQKSSSASTTVYVGKLYEKVTTGSLVEHNHYIYNGSRVVATYVQRNNGTSETQYLHNDHLGSIAVKTGGTGSVAQVLDRLSYDAFGKRRQVNGQDFASPPAGTLRRGFTEHEHDDDVGLINMNARQYDPTLGRFLTPDPTIQAPFESQSFNRYSYVMNNPLSLIDPTGFEAAGGGDGGGEFAGDVDGPAPVLSIDNGDGSTTHTFADGTQITMGFPTDVTPLSSAPPPYAGVPAINPTGLPSPSNGLPSPSDPPAIGYPPVFSSNAAAAPSNNPGAGASYGSGESTFGSPSLGAVVGSTAGNSGTGSGSSTGSPGPSTNVGGISGSPTTTPAVGGKGSGRGAGTSPTGTGRSGAAQILGGSMLGGAGLVGILGAYSGLSVGVAEGAHMGALAGLVVSDALVSGAIAGAVVGGAVGAVFAAVVIVAIYY